MFIPCPACAPDREPDAACTICLGRGEYRVDRCPAETLTADVGSLFWMVGLAEHGRMPVAGGVLDQSQSFIDGLRLIDRETAIWK